MTTPDHGHFGEQSMGFYFGERGFFFVDGPSGAGGHGLYDHGFDGVGYNPQTSQLIIYDNKSFSSSRNIAKGRADSIDPAVNLVQNLDAMIAQVQGMNDMPHRVKILEKLNQTRQAVHQFNTTSVVVANRRIQWPRGVNLALSNAGGESKGVTKYWSDLGMQFIDFANAPPPRRRQQPAPLAPPRTIEVKVPASARGQANAAATVAVFQIVDGLANYLNAGFQSEQANREVNMVLAGVRNWQVAHPGDGALIVVTFSRLVPSSSIVKKSVLIHPGDQFEFAAAYHAPTPERALEMWIKEPKATKGLDPTRSPYEYEWSNAFHWIEPVMRAAAGATLTSPVGWWRVDVGKYTWFYKFDAQGTVRWTDPFNNKTGKGTWKIQGGCVFISWAPGSTTTEKWDFPLNPTNATGTCSMQGETLPLKNAVHGVQPPPNVLNPPLETPAGKWRVEVGRFVWIYEFDAAGSITWTDPFNNKTGKGKWRIANGRMLTSWLPSRTTETWDFPLNPARQSGTSVMPGEGTFPLKATRL